MNSQKQAKIRERMADVGIRNFSAYMRKMALNGYVLHVDLAPVEEIVSLQRRCANNLNSNRLQGEYLWRSLLRRNQSPAKRLCGFMGTLSELLEKFSEVVAL